MTPAEIRRAQMIQIAHMKLVGTPNGQIAEVVGVDHSRIPQILHEEEYKLIEAELSKDKFEQNKAFNDSWDGLESLALNGLHETMQYNRDPILLLKIAQVANAAKKRGSINGNAPAVQGGTNRASMGLPAHFILQVQQNGGQLNISATPGHEVSAPLPGQQQQFPTAIQHDRDGKAIPQQRHNIMSPGKVQGIFEEMRKKDDVLDGLLDGIDVREAMQ